jgi:hypothetical protein
MVAFDGGAAFKGACDTLKCQKRRKNYSARDAVAIEALLRLNRNLLCSTKKW